MKLLGIFRSLHLANGRPRDANFNVIGDLQNNGVAVNTIDGSGLRGGFTIKIDISSGR